LRRLKLAATVMIAAAGLSAIYASGAHAFPSRTTACSNCHSGVNVPVTATLANTVGTTATYNVSAPGADSIAVFDGATKLSTINAATGQFSVTTGKTYTIYSVIGPGTGDGLGSTTVSPVAPAPVDATAPVTTSNAVATYVSSASITLAATDAGSGVANTYYRLDGGAQVSGRTINVSTLGSHTIEFWSVDVAGNIETHKTASFTITAPAPVDATAPVTTSNAVATYVSSASITLAATDAGSGVANTYYRLDGGAQVSGRTINVSTLGSHTIEFWSVDVAGNIETHKTASFTITAPAPVDATAPVTTSNAVATYVSSASITLAATDAGSGVANTYYRLDGGAQVSGRTINVSTLGSHTIEFWSVDVAGNIETHKTASFTITAPAQNGDSTLTISGSGRAFRNRTMSLSGALTPGSGDESVQLYVMRPGSTTWVLASTVDTRIPRDARPDRDARSDRDDRDDDGDDRDDDGDDASSVSTATWSARFRPTTRGTYQFQVRFAGDADSSAAVSRTITVVVR